MMNRTKLQTPRCRRCATFLVIAVVASCASERPRPSTDPDLAGAVPVVAVDAGLAVERGASDDFYDAFLEEALGGDVLAARAAYERVLADPHANDIHARAAMRLSDLEAIAGHRRRSAELATRIKAMDAEPALLELANEQLRRMWGGPSEVSGPPLATPLASVKPTTQAVFDAAEKQLLAYHRRTFRPRTEDFTVDELMVGRRDTKAKSWGQLHNQLFSDGEETPNDRGFRVRLPRSARHQQAVMEATSRAYEAVLSTGEPLAIIAADFRIASLYHDLAVDDILFRFPGGVEDRMIRAGVRAALKSRSLANLKQARVHYKRSLDGASRSELPPGDVERWRAAAEREFFALEGLLGRSERGPVAQGTPP